MPNLAERDSRSRFRLALVQRGRPAGEEPARGPREGAA